MILFWGVVLVHGHCKSVKAHRAAATTTSPRGCGNLRLLRDSDQAVILEFGMLVLASPKEAWKLMWSAVERTVVTQKFFQGPAWAATWWCQTM